MTTSMICSGVFFLIGLSIMALGWKTYRKSSRVASWLTTTGIVTVSEVIRSMGSELKYSAHIVYQYSVNGVSYSSNKITPAELMDIADTGQNEAVAKVKKYPLQSTVTIYYDPQDPQRAVLEKGGDASLFFLGAFFLAFALAIFFVG